MSDTKIPLSQIKVASPCTAPWEAMSGDDTTRFCGQCAQYVYNLSEMTQEEAEALVSENEGHLCVRFYRRADGTMMSKDCPVGWRAVKRRAAIIAGVGVAVMAATFSVFTLGVFAGMRGNDNGPRLPNPIARVWNMLFPPAPLAIPPAPPPPFGGGMVMGGMCVVPEPVPVMPPLPNIEPVEREQPVPVVPLPR